MKICICSDTHDNILNYQKFLLHCEDNNFDCLIHCGDWCSVETLKLTRDYFSGHVFGVFGNVHAEDEKMLKTAKTIDINLKKHQNDLIIDKIRTSITHKPQDAQFLALTDEYDIVFYGHTHKPWKKIINKTHLVNPGTLSGMFMTATFATYDTTTRKLKLIRLDQINNVN